MSKEHLLYQFGAAYDEDRWFIGVKNAINGTSPEAAAWKPKGISNSIHEILNHLLYYNEAYLRRFKGIEYEYEVESNEETFDGEEDWPSTAARFQFVMDEFRDLIRKADESKFDEMSPPRNTVSWRTVIGNICLHNAHHGGQIVMIRKLQGSWDKTWGET